MVSSTSEIDTYNSASDSEKIVLILGGTGLLGSTLKPNLESCGYIVYVHGLTTSALYNANISDQEEAYKLLDLLNPAIIINLIALTDVDYCELYPNEAYLVNVRTVENIVGWIKKRNKYSYLVHISTDHVYDQIGLNKESEVVLKNYYSFSKFTGELAASSVSSVVLRTNFFGLSCCKKRLSLTDWLFRSLVARKSIQVFEDVYFSPLSMNTLSNMIELIIQHKLHGIYNLGSRSGLSKADFAYVFALELNYSAQEMSRISIDNAKILKTFRPKDMRMDSRKIETALGIILPTLEDEIKKAAREYDVAN